MTAEPTHIIVESMAACYAIPHSNGADRIWLTTSPAVYERLGASGQNVRFLDAGLSQAEADSIGYLACDLTCWLSDRIDATVAAAGITQLRPGLALRTALQRTLVKFLYKGFLIDKLVASGVDRVGILAVGNPELEPVKSFVLRTHRFETLFAAIAKAAGLPVHAFDTPLPDLPETGDVHLPSLADRVLTAINAEPSALLYKAWRALLRGARLSLGRGRPRILIDGNNDLIEEIFVSLLLRGYDVERMPSVNVPLVATPWAGAASRDEALKALMEAAAANGIAAGDATRAGFELALQRVYDCLAWAPSMAEKASRVAEHVKSLAGGRQVAVLSATMHTGYPLMVMEALNALGVRTFKAEHGSAPGQSPLQKSLARLSNADKLADTLYYTGAQVDEAKELFGGALPCALAGAPRCVKEPKLYALQRLLARRRMKLSGRHIVWCTGIYPNNEQFLPHYWIDGQYHLLRKSMIEESLGGLADRVTIKLHPAARYVDGDPLHAGMLLPPNCVTIPDQDFRYLRTTADVVIVDGPGSVLSWALGMNVPVVYVEFGMYVLTDVAEAAFRAGMPFIDARQQGWQAELRALLELPHAELVSRYAAMAGRRKHLCEQYVFGPEGSPARRSVDFITGRLMPGAA